MEDGLTKLFVKCAAGPVQWGSIMKEFVIPSVAIGGGIGAGIGALTSSKKDDQGSGGKVGGAMKGLALGAVGDAVTGVGQGLLKHYDGWGATWDAAKSFLTKAAELEQKLIPIVSKMTKQAESNYGLDFLAGADPTGRATFEISKNNTKHHAIHKTMADIGGFIAGSAATTALTAGGMYAAGKILKHHPVGESLARSAKDMLITLNPKKTYQAIKRFGPAKNIVKADLANMKNVQHAYEDVGSTLKDHDALNFSTLRSKASNAFNHKASIDKNLAATKAFKAKHGLEPIHALEEGGAAVAGVASGVIGGSMNALSSQSQYSVGQEFRKVKEEANSEKSKLKKVAEISKVAVSEKLVDSALAGVAEKLKLAKTRNERFPLHIQNIIFNKYKREKFPVPHKMRWFI